MHLLVHPNGSKYWRLQYRYEGKQKMLALGVYPEITLADARVRRDETRKLLANGVDPGDKKKNDKVEQSKARTFKEVAIEWHGTNKKWSEDHAHRVLKSLEDNLFAALGERNIAELKTRDLLAPIKAVEMSGRLEVAARLQQRTTAIMRYAVQSGLIDYNPAQEMAGAVASCNRQHRPALELKRIPELLTKIDSYTGRPLTRWAIELTLLIFIRSSELRFARWSEIDFEASIWTIPPEREPIPGVKHSHRGSKMRTTHLVPLSTQALAILKQIKQFYGAHDLIFIGDHDSHKPMSENTVNSALRVMGYDTKVEVCGHGFRTMACSSLWLFYPGCAVLSFGAALATPAYQLLLNDKLADGAGAGWLATSHTLGYGLCALLVPLVSKTGVAIALIMAALFATILFTIVSVFIWHYRTIK